MCSNNIVRFCNAVTIPSYDKQASAYDARAGMGDDISRQVAKAVFTLAQRNSKGRLLDIGCGTGEIGCYLSELATDYTGIDRSPSMLAEFQNRLSGQIESARLVEADGDLSWPVTSQTIDLVFSSRALHLLNLEHVLNETQRIASETGITCVIGRVTRDKQGLSQSMRRQMRKILEQYGYKGRSGKRNLDNIRQHCNEAGAKELAMVNVANWQSFETPVQSINSWRNKAGLAGLDLPYEIKETVLEKLEQWAIEQYGSINLIENSTSSYELHGFYFPSKSIDDNE